MNWFQVYLKAIVSKKLCQCINIENLIDGIKNPETDSHIYDHLVFCFVLFIKTSARKKSDQIRRSVVSDSLWPHELQHARPPCPSPTPGVHSDSCPLSQWCHPLISRQEERGRCGEWACGQGGEGEGGTNWETRIDIYTLPWGHSFH